MADLFGSYIPCALDHMAPKIERRFKCAIMMLMCHGADTHAHWPYNVRHIILHLLQGDIHPNMHVLHLDVMYSTVG